MSLLHLLNILADLRPIVRQLPLVHDRARAVIVHTQCNGLLVHVHTDEQRRSEYGGWRVFLHVIVSVWVSTVDELNVAHPAGAVLL